MGTREECLNKASEYVTADRASTYGKPENNFGNIAKIWNAQGVRIDERKVKAHDVALMMAGMKLARLRHNPSHEDSWIDIAGYAACGMEIATQDDDCCASKDADSDKSGFLYMAPLGDIDVSKWVPLGFTTEGVNESFSVPASMLDDDVVQLSDAIRRVTNEAVDRWFKRSVQTPVTGEWNSDMYRCELDGPGTVPHKAHTYGRNNGQWCDGFV